MKDELKDQTKAQLFGRIPQYSNLKLLWKDRSPRMLAAGFLGGAAALAVYPFLTGDGSAVNSMVCVALFFEHRRPDRPPAGPAHHPAEPAAGQKGLAHGVNRGFIDRIFAGFAVGMAAAVPVSCTKKPRGGLCLAAAGLGPAHSAGGALGVFCLVLPAVKTKKGDAPAKEVRSK